MRYSRYGIIIEHRIRFTEKGKPSSFFRRRVYKGKRVMPSRKEGKTMTTEQYVKAYFNLNRHTLFKV